MNLFIAIPCYGGNISNLTFHSLFNSIKPLNDMGHNIIIKTLPEESLISRGRNKFVTMFLDDKKFDGTHLLFIDADIGFDVENILRLINFNKEVVTCNYPVKGFYWEQLIKKIKENKDIDEKTIRDSLLQFNVNFYNPDNIQTNNGFARVMESATGFMMIKREVFTTIMNKNPHLKYIPDFRSGLEESDNAYDFFPVGCYKEKDGVTRYLSEDYYFCRLVEECGFQIWTDISTPITHLGSAEYHGAMITQLYKK
jgi:hypothetical protein